MQRVNHELLAADFDYRRARIAGNDLAFACHHSRRDPARDRDQYGGVRQRRAAVSGPCPPRPDRAWRDDGTHARQRWILVWVQPLQSLLDQSEQRRRTGAMKPRLGSRKIKKLVATFALLCVSSTVLAHDIYSNLRDRDGRLCCNGQDCRPVQVTVLPNGSYYLPSTGEIISAEMATPSPDDRFHHCIYYPMATEFDRSAPVWESKPKTRCFFAPMHSS